MGQQSKIEWTDDTASFWSGCDRVSKGCRNCYITSTVPMRSTGRKHGDPRVWHQSGEQVLRAAQRKPWVCDQCGNAFSDPPYGTVATRHRQETGHRQPHRRRVFINSLSDWLDPKVPIEWLAKLLDAIRLAPDVTCILLSKRVELWRERLEQCAIGEGQSGLANEWLDGNEPKNVWVLASVENQSMADKRILELLKIPAAVHGLSLEPLLGPILLKRSLLSYHIGALDWIVIGGESGKGARPCEVAWIRSLLRQGQAAGVPVFVKQIHGEDGKLLKDMADFPADLQIREYPTLSV